MIFDDLETENSWLQKRNRKIKIHVVVEVLNV